MGVADRKAREFTRREEEILATALNLAGGGDWVSVTIDDIAERAEIGKGTFYLHFKSKDEVCARLVMDHATELLQKLRAIDPSMEFVPRLKEGLRTFWRHTLANREVMALKTYCDATEPKLNLSEGMAAKYWHVRDQVEQFFAHVVNEGIERGIIAQQPIKHIMYAGMATMMGAMRMMDHSLLQELGEDAFLEYLIDYILKGMMNAQGPAAAR